MVSVLGRTLKIDLLLDNPNEISTYFNNICKNIIIENTNAYHSNGGEYIYYIRRNNGTIRILFYHDVFRGLFRCSYSLIWIRIKKNFDINRDSEVQQIIKILFENKYNTIIPTPLYIFKFIPLYLPHKY